MPYYSDELIEKVREANDIVDVIGQYVHLVKKGSTYFGLCPFHNEKTPSFSVSQNKQMYYCFGCGAGGNVFSFLMNYENMSFPEAMQELAGKAGIELPVREMTVQERAREDKRSRLLEINKEAAKFYYAMLHGPGGTPAMDYFRRRELTDETLKNWGLGYTGSVSNGLYRYLHNKGYSDRDLADSGLVTIDEKRGPHDKFWNRAMFPIMDANSRVIAFGGRVMGDGEPKYLNSPETMIFNKSRTLFGLFRARRTKRPQFILCEGYMDVISMHQAGFDNTVASLGTALTEGHAQILKRHTREVYLSYDSDGAGVKAALRAIPILKNAGITCKVINMRPYKDPDEFMKALGPEEYQKRIDEAENSFMYEIRMLERDFDMSDPESNTEFFKEVASRIGRFPEELERENYIRAVAQKYQRQPDSIRQMVIHMASRDGIMASRAGGNGPRRSSSYGRRRNPQAASGSAPGSAQFDAGSDDRFGDDVFAMAEAYAGADAEQEAAYGGGGFASDYGGMDGYSPAAGADTSPEAAMRGVSRQKGNPRENGDLKTQRLLLTWIAEDERVYHAVSTYITPEDFSPGIYRRVAEEVWQQMQEGGVSPARVVDHFRQEDDSVQQEVAKIFNTTVGEISGQEARQKALQEVVVKMKKASLARLVSSNSTAPDILQRIVNEKRMIPKIHIQL